MDHHTAEFVFSPPPPPTPLNKIEHPALEPWPHGQICVLSLPCPTFPPGTQHSSPGSAGSDAGHPQHDNFLKLFVLNRYPTDFNETEAKRTGITWRSLWMPKAYCFLRSCLLPGSVPMPTWSNFVLSNFIKFTSGNPFKNIAFDDMMLPGPSQIYPGHIWGNSFFHYFRGSRGHIF